MKVELMTACRGSTLPQLSTSPPVVRKGKMATIGRSHAIAEIGGLQLTSLMAWLALHLFFLIGFRNRILVLLQWTNAYSQILRG